MADQVGNVAPLDGNSMYKETTKTSGNSVLGKDAFLNLLVAQMKYQDPLQPMSNTESIAQLAQFSALEQMTNVATSQQKSSAYALIGKTVVGNKYTAATGITETIQGVVSSVKQSGSDVFLRIGDVDLPFSAVTDVMDGNVNALGAINSNIATSQSLGLIGKNIQAVVSDAKGNVVEFVEGKVDYVKIAGGRTILMVNDKEIFAEEVLLVSGENKLIGKPAKGVVTDDEGVETVSSGEITGITFDKNKPFLVIGKEKFEINTISDVTEGLNLIGKTVDISGVAGKIDGIKIKERNVYVTIGDKELKLETVKNALK